MYDKLRKALKGQSVTVSDTELSAQFVADFDNYPPLCCIADLQSWCTTNNLTLTNNENNTYTITKNS